MTARQVLLYPHPLLRHPKNDPVWPDHPFRDDVIRDLIDSLEISPGVALAAPQIGYALRAIIVDVSRDRRPERRSGHGRVLLVNPRILEASTPLTVREGCLSVPDYTGNVTRYSRVVIEGLGPEGRYRVLESQGFEAVAFQHEVDHLEGKLFLDRITSPHADLFRRRGR